MFVMEENRQGRSALRPLSSLYLCQGACRVAVEVNVVAKIKRSCHDHDPCVVHPLSSLPLATGKVCQVLALAIEDNVDGVLHDILWELLDVVTDLNTFAYGKDGHNITYVNSPQV